MNRETFVTSFAHLADAPGGFDRLRGLILDLAISGKLVGNGTVGWRTVPLSKIARLQYGYAFASKHFNTAGQGLPLVRIRDVVRGRSETCYSGEYDNRFLVEDGDYLVGMDGSFNLARWRGGRALLNQRVCKIAETDESLDVHYLARILPSALQHIHDATPFVTVKHLSARALNGVEVPLPPIGEQHAIVERIDKLQGLCDELERLQAVRTQTRVALTASALLKLTEADQAENMGAGFRPFVDNIGLHLAPGEGDLDALRRLRQTIIDLAVRGRLTHQDDTEMPASGLLQEVAAERARLVRAKFVRRPRELAPAASVEIADSLPHGWALTKAADFFIASDSGWSPQCLIEPAGPGEWGVLKTSAVSRGVFEAGQSKKLPPAMTPRPQLEVRPGDFVMIRASGSKTLVGRGAIVTETEARLMLSDKHIRLSFLHEVSTRYWAVLNNSTAVQSYYSSESSGSSTMSNVTRDRIGNLVVAVPPLAEQRRIVDRVETLLGICDELEQQSVAAAELRRDLAASVTAHAALGSRPG